MKLAVELFFDEETERKLLHLAERIAAEGLNTKYFEWKTRPHVTLAIFDSEDEEACIERIKSFAKDREALPAYIGSVGMFTDTKTIFASPVMTAPMYQFQRELHGYFDGFDTRGYEWYLPDRWVPHCALALMSEDDEELFYKACDLVLREFEKINGKFSSIGLVKITFPVEEIFVTGLCS